MRRCAHADPPTNWGKSGTDFVVDVRPPAFAEDVLQPTGLVQEGLGVGGIRESCLEVGLVAILRLPGRGVEIDQVGVSAHRPSVPERFAVLIPSISLQSVTWWVVEKWRSAIQKVLVDVVLVQPEPLQVRDVVGRARVPEGRHPEVYGRRRAFLTRVVMGARDRVPRLLPSIRRREEPERIEHVIDAELHLCDAVRDLLGEHVGPGLVHLHGSACPRVEDLVGIAFVQNPGRSRGI
mmetsp:Transcript_49314/g.138130  ORF Transcript_49314/g.138130 Transcript_49314/m.138130 type:complete len:236 (-) Transcript_49314:196-903(-)